MGQTVWAPGPVLRVAPPPPAEPLLGGVASLTRPELRDFGTGCLQLLCHLNNSIWILEEVINDCDRIGHLIFICTFSLIVL